MALKTVALSPRLRALVDALGDWHGVGDIGSDHAMLPISLALSARGSRGPIVATDVAAGPASAARRAVAEFGVDRWVEVRQGYGLEPLQVGEVDTIVIAGMGMATIRGILEADIERGLLLASHPTKLVIQAAGFDSTLRSWLQKKGFALAEQSLAREGRRFYAVDVVTRHAASPSVDPSWEVAELEALGVRPAAVLKFGPLLLARRNANLGALLASESRRIGVAHASAVGGGRGAASSRADELLDELRELEVMQQWVSRSSG